MKHLIIFTMLLIFSATSFSQETNSSQALTRAGYLQKSKKQKTTAWILLGGGSTLVITGLLLNNQASFDNAGTTAVVAIAGEFPC